MSIPFDFLPVEARRKVRRAPQPEWCKPTLATLTREPFSNPNWIFEPKLDGIRCLAFRKGRSLKLFSRNALLLNDRFPELVKPLLNQESSGYILDGEVVALERGVSRFAVLQQRMQVKVAVFYYVFDLIYCDGYDLTQLELQQRKEILQRRFAFLDPIRYTAHRQADGEAFYQEACAKGWEGIIAKRASSVYVHQRSAEWLKFKCENQQEFVIIGYTDPAGQREGIGALLIGLYEKARLLYAGKVGTGFNTPTLLELQSKLSKIERRSPACVCDSSLPRAHVHWVQPKYVAQIAFTEWTGAGKLRHPRFLGLRIDKKPSEVVRERAPV
jgi:bifunctional non-homologous end joining protein LigD